MSDCSPPAPIGVGEYPKKLIRARIHFRPPEGWTRVSSFLRRAPAFRASSGKTTYVSFASCAAETSLGRLCFDFSPPDLPSGIKGRTPMFWNFWRIFPFGLRVVPPFSPVRALPCCKPLVNRLPLGVVPRFMRLKENLFLLVLEAPRLV